MKKKIALGTAAAAAVTALLSGGIAANASSTADNATPTAAQSPAPVSSGAYKIADDLLKADSTLHGPRLNQRYNLWVVGLHGRATVRDKGPTFIDYTWQRGAITAVASTAGNSWLSVKSNDGVTRTWILAPSTRIRRDGHKTDVSKLVVGDRVFVIGVPGKPVASPSPSATPTTGDPAAGGELSANTHPTAAAVVVPRNKSVAN